MIRIRQVHSTALWSDRDAVTQVQEIFRDHFTDVAEYAAKIPDQLDHPFKYGYQAVLLVSENAAGKVTGFSHFFHLPEVNSGLLDFLAVRRGIRGGGLGGALYEATREYLQDHHARAMYMEVLPDDPAVVTNPAMLGENWRRLAFYERYGARPIANTEYETPIDESPAPYLVYDGLGRTEPLGRSEARAAVRLILRRKYAALVSPDYIERVVESFIDDPVLLRSPRYVKRAVRPKPVQGGRLEKGFALVASVRHAIHHVRSHGYVERPARVGALLETLTPLNLFRQTSPKSFGERYIRAVHDPDFVSYLQRVCKKLSAKRPVYPYVFPIRRPHRKPDDLSVCAGYYCIDTFTPLDKNAYDAARAAVDVALTAASLVRGGTRTAYALCRPPGHHAERRVFGGFCYFNNAAIAAHFLSREGKVAVLDIDFHHGNGTQDIFYRRADVLTLSLHGHPHFAYPYFSGFGDELGEGDGKGFNRNYPLPEETNELLYLTTLDRAIKRLRTFAPTYLVVSLGLDTMKGDPTGTFSLRAQSMYEIGRRLGGLSWPTLIVQEGGYNLLNIRRGAAAFFNGLADGQTARA